LDFKGLNRNERRLSGVVVLAAVPMKSFILWNETPYSLVNIAYVTASTLRIKEQVKSTRNKHSSLDGGYLTVRRHITQRYENLKP
jgi:hypothetical protein